MAYPRSLDSRSISEGEKKGTFAVLWCGINDFIENAEMKVILLIQIRAVELTTVDNECKCQILSLMY